MGSCPPRIRPAPKGGVGETNGQRQEVKIFSKVATPQNFPLQLVQSGSLDPTIEQTSNRTTSLLASIAASRDTPRNEFGALESVSHFASGYSLLS